MMYNRLIRLKNNIEKAWSNIDVLLKQRFNELTNLMETVKGYMKHEKTVLSEVTAARTNFMHARTVGEKADANFYLTSAFRSIFAVAENYPQLKASDNFLQLQNRISALEDAIADRREFYNDSVTTFNTRIEQIPYVFLASLLDYRKIELFRASEYDKRYIKTEF